MEPFSSPRLGDLIFDKRRGKLTKYRLLALDLDETLLTKDKRITAESKVWISRAIEAGVVVIFATGRGLQRVADFRKELKMDSPMVLVNGAEIWGKDRGLLSRHFISRENIHMLHRLAIEVGASFWGYSVEGLTNQKNWTEAMFHRDWMKFGIKHDDQQVINQLKRRIQGTGTDTLEITSSSPVNLEFSFKGISKKMGVQKICTYLGIGMEDVMAIGDNLNDFKLIQAAGLGVAMGNADDRLKQVADQVTETNEADGVAKAIQNFLVERG